MANDRITIEKEFFPRKIQNNYYECRDIQEKERERENEEIGSEDENGEIL